MFVILILFLTAKDMKNELLGLAASMQAKDAEQVDLQYQVLRLLLNSKTSSFCFPPALNPDHTAAATQLCQSLLDENPPNLHTLTIKTLNKNKQSRRNVSDFLNQMLPVFCNLETLTLKNFKCCDVDIRLISDHLPHLR
jgi:hypothetical protein